jgi:V/A-type H+-transporting ATPase subunit D
MAKELLNKSVLHRMQAQLTLYEKVLPSLDLKRKKLLAESGRTRQAQQQLRSEQEAYNDETARRYPMLLERTLGHQKLVRIEKIDESVRNVVGVRLPELTRVVFAPPAYTLLGTPAWTELLVTRMQTAVEMELEGDFIKRRIRLLERALKKVTQRVNLFEKVLIPQTKEQIKKTVIALEEVHRSSVIRSKLAKAKHREVRR